MMTLNARHPSCGSRICLDPGSMRRVTCSKLFELIYRRTGEMTCRNSKSFQIFVSKVEVAAWPGSPTSIRYAGRWYPWHPSITWSFTATDTPATRPGRVMAGRTWPGIDLLAHFPPFATWLDWRTYRARPDTDTANAINHISSDGITKLCIVNSRVLFDTRPACSYALEELEAQASRWPQ